MPQQKNFVTFGPSDWWASNPSCCTHIMACLSKSNRVIYVNPISSDFMGVHSSKGLLTRVLRKAKSMLKCFRRVEKNLYVLSPLFIPVQGVPFFDRMNNALLRIQLGFTMLLLRFKQPILWVENIRSADFLGSFSWKSIIYHVSDRFEECPYTKNKEKLAQRERDVTNNSDLLICVSKELYDSKKALVSNVIYLPHGVDFEEFRIALEKENPFENISEGKRGAAGYFGTLTAQNDIELLEHCAEKLQNVMFVFAGQITAGDYDNLKKMNNVHFIGKVPYDEIPSLCASFDVCLLPWKMNKWIENCNPLKLKEYMASGNPIVSVPIREVKENYSDFISVANSKEEFCERIEWELQNDTPERQTERIRIASEHSWDKHVQIIESEIDKLLKAEG